MAARHRPAARRTPPGPRAEPPASTTSRRRQSCRMPPMRRGGPTHRANQCRSAWRRYCEGRSIELIPKRADLLAHRVREKCEISSALERVPVISNHLFGVMAGLVAAIYVFLEA